MKPGKEVQYEERFGVPTFVWTAPSSAEEKRARGQRARDAAGEARRHLSTYASILELAPGDVAAAKVSGIHDTGRGAIIVKFREEVGGIEIFREELSVAMDRSLERIAVSGYLSGAPRHLGQGNAFRLDRREATAAALADRIGSEISAGDLVLTGRTQETYEFVDYGERLRATSRDQLVDPARVKPVYFHLPDRFEPSYYVEITVESTDEEGEVDNDLYAYVISARDGAVLYRNNLTVSDSFTYRLWADTSGGSVDIPSDSPHGNDFTPHPTGNPDGSAPPYVPSSLHTLQAFPFAHAATDPWLPAAATETVGNNVDAYVDRFGADGYTPASGDFRANLSGPGAFDYTYDPTQGPLVSANQQKAAITSLFYIDNFLHDWFYDAGFDEAARNAQTNNYGRGGIGNDSIRAEAQDGSGTNNANMATPSDGGRPRQQMFLWSGPQNETITVNSQPPGGTLPAAYNPFQIGTAAFGPQVFDVTADVVRAIPNDACAPLTNAAAVAGKIAFVDRGGACAAGFSTKDANAAAAGAVGVIIANVASSVNPTIAPGMAATNPPCPAQPNPSFGTCTIGALSLNFADGEAWRAALALGTVNARMKRDAVIQRDGSLDAHVVAHEWGHYLSNRLVHNSRGLGTQQSSGMGEGWSDFVSLLTTVREGDDLVSSNASWSGIYALVPYGAVSFTSDPYYFGIRRLPYSTDMSKDPLTFRHISNGVALPCATVPISSGCAGTNNAEVHNTGEVWATMLWEGFAALLNTHPFDDARLRMRDYLVASLKLTPAQPTFVEARDAVLAAAFAADPADHALFCEAFAKRGIGQRAVAPDRFSTTNAGVVESFECANDLQFVSATLGATTATCDADPYLDNFETAPLTITLRNDGANSLSDTSAVVSSTNPNVVFANGGQVTFPPSNPGGTTTASIAVSISGATGVQDFLIDIAFTDSAITLEPPVLHGTAAVRGNADDLANASASDNAEAILTAWTPTGTGLWARNRFDSTPPFNSDWLGQDPSAVSDSQLVSPPLNVAPIGSFSFTFLHRYSLEATFDGGVVEISTNNGATWTDVGAAALSPTYAAAPLVPGSALAGRRAYTGTSAGYPNFVAVTCNLGTAYQGQTVRIRFRVATDVAVGGTGWEIDDLVFNNITNTPFTAIAAQAAAASTTTLAAAASQYSDQVTLSATVASCNNTPTGTVQFQIDRNDGSGFVNAGAPASLSGGTATRLYTVGEKAGSYAIKAIYTPDNAFVTGSSDTDTLTVSKEDAAITPSTGNPGTVQVVAPGGNANFTLSASAAEAQNGAGHVSGTTDLLGDICKAGLPAAPTITLTPVGPGGTISLNATVVCGGGAFTFSADFTNVPVNVYDVAFALRSDWYVGSASSVVAVYDPSLGFTTGGGTVLNNGYVANFGFNVKYLRNGGAQGTFLYVEHRPEGDLKIKSNSMKSLSVVGNTAVGLTKNATLNGIGNYNVRFVGVDNGAGPTDRFGMTLFDQSNAPVTGLDFSGSPATLSSGNVVVPQNQQ